MNEESKMIGENGCVFIDNSVTNEDIYMIHVVSDAVFTVLNETDAKGGSETDVLSTMNLSGNTIPAGAILTPYDEVFSDVSISSGSLIAYKLGR
jgi:hypothetical protein